jgi:hypothetical protein
VNGLCGAFRFFLDFPLAAVRTFHGQSDLAGGALRKQCGGVERFRGTPAAGKVNREVLDQSYQAE